MNTTDTAEKRIESPLDLDNDTRVALLRFCAKELRDELAKDDDSEWTADERAYVARGADGFEQAADMLAADPDSPIVAALLWYAFDDGWDDYQQHLADAETAAAEGEAGQ